MVDRYHRAAKDGYLEVLKEATKKDCNLRDEEGMTPTLFAAYEGNLDALRLLVGRGGDPEKSDHFGNTALHLAASRGHLNCVTFLVNFGVNMFVQDIDNHTPQELAAMNDCTEIIKYLDLMAGKKETDDPKTVKRQKDQAEKDVQKLIANFKKVQKKADRMKSQNVKDLEEKTKKMEIKDTIDPRRDSIAVHGNNTMKFSEMVGTTATGNASRSKIMGTVFRKANQRKTRIQDDTFKVRDKQNDGKLTVRNLSGLRRDSEILFVAQKDNDEADADEEANGGGGVSNGHGEKPYFPGIRRDTFGIFDRPGFGNVTFRRDSMAATLMAVEAGGEDSEGSEDEDKAANSDGEAETAPSFASIDLFLAGLGLQKYIAVFRKQKIDLETLMLLNEQNLMEMKIEIGPRKKIMQAIDERRRDMSDEAPIKDSPL